MIAHGGGMMTGANRQTVSPQLRNYVMPHDRRIAEYTGQPFGEAYFEGLLRDETAVFDSAPPIAAVLAAEQIAGRGLELLGRLQSAHYEEGRRIADEAVLLELAKDIGLEPQAFQAAFKEAETDRHIKDSRALLGRGRRPGFPDLRPGTQRPIHPDRYRPVARQAASLRGMAESVASRTSVVIGASSLWPERLRPLTSTSDFLDVFRLFTDDS